MNFIYSLLVQYRYLILFPLAAIEGPIISLAVGFLIYLGFFSVVPAYILLVFGDLIPDTIYYYLGRYGNKKRILDKYIERSDRLAHNMNLLEKLWHDHGKKTMFFSKLAYGLSTPFLISAGLVKMPYKKFVSYALPVTLLQYAVLLTIGYYLGYSYASAARYVEDAGLIIAAAFVVFVGLFFAFQKYARHEIEKLEEEEKI
jgi:membrane protein DedA with SNARE-associated domain